MKWYEKAKRLMDQQNIKQDDLIIVMDVKTRGAVGHYLSGRRQPTLDQFIALTKKLRCTPNELLLEDYATQEHSKAYRINEHKQTVYQDDWNKLQPKTRAFIEDFMNKAKTGKLNEDKIKALQNILDLL